MSAKRKISLAAPFPREPSTSTARRTIGRSASEARPGLIQPGVGEAPRRRVDLLQAELSNERITPEQYAVGRMIEAVFERGSGACLGTATWGEVRSGSTAQDLAIILRVEDARRIDRFVTRLEQEVGRKGVRMLRAILADGHTFKTYAALRGRAGELGVRSIAEHFRIVLEDLAEGSSSATGPDRTPIRGGAC